MLADIVSIIGIHAAYARRQVTSRQWGYLITTSQTLGQG